MTPLELPSASAGCELELPHDDSKVTCDCNSNSLQTF
jgi:hypothetical protein